MMKTSDLEIVRDLPLFSDMDAENFAALMSAAFLQRFPAGLILIREGQRADFLHVVVEGLVELFSEVNAREIGVGLVRPVSTFILAAVIKDAVYLNSARTLENTIILMIPAEQVRMVFGRDEHFARSIVGELAGTYRRMMKKLKGQMARSGVERLANWLLSHMTVSGSGGELTLPIDRTTLAAHLGTTRENLARNFTQLASYGVHARGRQITVADVARLTEIARPEPLIDSPET